jgi:hypothetical protein
MTENGRGGENQESRGDSIHVVTLAVMGAGARWIGKLSVCIGNFTRSLP